MSGEYVLKILARADGVVDDHAGRYLVSFDPETGRFIGGKGTIMTTAAIARAKRFPDQRAALEFWRTQHGTRPWDGKANRPLTAYTVEALPA